MSESTTRKLSPEVEARQKIEREIILAFIDSVIFKGYVAVIDNGGDEDERIRVTDLAHASEAIMATDEDRVYVYSTGSATAEPKQVGWAYFVYGNDGWDVLADYSTRLENLGLMTVVNQIIQKHTPQ